MLIRNVQIKTIVTKYVPYTAAVLICFLMLYKVRTSALFGDDWPNSYNGYWAKYLYPDSTNLFTVWFKDTYIWTNSWIERAGRIIPGGLLLARIFIVLPYIEFYKLLQIISIVIVLMMIIKLLSLYFKQKTNSAIIALGFFIFLQFRNDYDPYIGFTFILPISTMCILGTAIYLLKIDQSTNPKLKWYLLIFMLPTISSLTYEYTIILTPIFLLILMNNGNIEWRKFRLFLISISGPLILAVIQIGILRPRRIIREGTYESNFDVIELSKTAIKQMIAIFPNSQAIFGTISTPNFKLTNFLILLLLIYPIIFAYFKISEEGSVLRVSNLVPITIIAFWFLIAPPILVGSSKQWQEILHLGNAYLPIFYQHIGATIIFFILISLITSYLTSKNVVISKLSTVVFIFLMSGFLALSMTFQIDSNNRLLFNDNYKTNRFEMLKFAISKGLLEEVSQGSTIISYDTNDTHEINRAVFSIESAIDLTDMKLPSQIWSPTCLEDAACPLSAELNEVLKYQIRSSNNSNMSIKVPYEVPIYGISHYYGERYKTNEFSKPYFMDALYYANTAVLYTISPITITNKDVLIDRDRGTAVWVSLDEGNPFLPKKMTESSCLDSSQVNRDTINNILWSKVSIRGFGETDFRSSQNGQYC